MLCDFACSSPLHNCRPMSRRSQIENPSLRASMVAMLLPCMYSMAAQNWPSTTLAAVTLVMLGLFKTLVASDSASSACSSAPALSPNALNWIAFRATVWPLSSLALYTVAVGDFASSLKISNWPSLVDISFRTPFHRKPFATRQSLAGEEIPGMGTLRISPLDRVFELLR